MELGKLRRFLLGWNVGPSQIHSCVTRMEKARGLELITLGRCLLCLVYHYFRLPEPSGRTFAEVRPCPTIEIWNVQC